MNLYLLVRSNIYYSERNFIFLNPTISLTTLHWYDCIKTPQLQ